MLVWAVASYQGKTNGMQSKHDSSANSLTLYHPTVDAILCARRLSSSLSLHLPVCLLSTRQVDELQKSLAFVSISTDGDVLLWTLAMCELLPERLIHLRPSAQHQAGDSSASGVGVTACSGAASSSAVAAADEMLPQQQADGGLCMDFSKVCSTHACAVCSGGEGERNVAANFQ